MITKLIIIRGPSGAGKSTVAKELRKLSKRPTLLVSEDEVRNMFNDHQKTGHDIARLLSTNALFLGLKSGYDVVYEGILNIKTRSTQFDEIFKIHPTENYFFYLDVSFDETMKRHQIRLKDPKFEAKFNSDAMKKWWDFASPTNYPSETIIDESSTVKEALEIISNTTSIELQARF